MKPAILVCEDNEGIIDVMKIVLEDMSYRVIAVSNGNLALQSVKTDRPKLILMDLWLPGMNGDDITKQLKSEPETKDIPIIIVSASRDAETVAQEVGADGALKKPFDITDLETIVKKHIQK